MYNRVPILGIFPWFSSLDNALSKALRLPNCKSSFAVKVPPCGSDCANARIFDVTEVIGGYGLEVHTTGQVESTL